MPVSNRALESQKNFNYSLERVGWYVILLENTILEKGKEVKKRNMHSNYFLILSITGREKKDAVMV